DADWPSDIDIQTSTIASNEESGVRMDGTHARNHGVLEGVTVDRSAALAIEANSDIGMNGRAGILAAGNSSVQVDASTVDGNGVANDCSVAGAQAHSYGVEILGQSRLWASSATVQGNAGGGIYVDSGCGTRSAVGIACAPLGSDADVWTSAL